MAPESERAKRCKFQRAGEHMRCELEAGHVGAHVCHGLHCGCADCVKKDWTPESAPTLTCSEVVERLATEAHLAHGYCTGFSRTKAEAILHSWRERRVQELERQNKYLSGELSKWDKGLETLRGRIRELENSGRSSVTDID